MTPLSRHAESANTLRRKVARVLARRCLLNCAVRLLIDADAWDEIADLIVEACATTHPLVAADVMWAWYQALPQDRPP